MGLIKSQAEIAGIRDASRMAHAVLAHLGGNGPPRSDDRMSIVRPARRSSAGERGARFWGTGISRDRRASVNDEVVHGMGGARRLQFGDIVSLDVGVLYRGFVGDTAATFPVGGCDPGAQRLMEVTREALRLGIAAAGGGQVVADISLAVQTCVESGGYSVVREFVGHGVGRSVHEDPQIPNFVEGRGKSPRLHPGMTIAIEPMVNAGRPEVRVLNDGWTVGHGGWQALRPFRAHDLGDRR